MPCVQDFPGAQPTPTLQILDQPFENNNTSRPTEGAVRRLPIISRVVLKG